LSTAASLYSHFVTVIDSATSNRDIFAIKTAAKAAGLQGTVQPRGTGQRWDFHFVDSNGDILIIHARYWDQSKAFSIRPDMHVMSAVLVEKGRSREYERRYEE